jgi:hypothetical protein
VIRLAAGIRRHLLATAVTVVLAATVTAPVSRADGDPASDYLLTQNVYFPNQSTTQAVSGVLERTANGIYARGDRIKVALIYDVTDLGAIPSMFGKPAEYAHYLGIELGLWYLGPLLVVTPAGFGVYDGGRSTAAEEEVLRSVPISSGSPDDLTRSATAALQRLAAADALHSPDIRAPLATAHPASANRGKQATLRFDVFDDSGRSKAIVRIYEDGSVVAIVAVRAGFKIGTRGVRVRWLVPTTLTSRRLRFCVVASDPAGNRSAPACAPFLRVG